MLTSECLNAHNDNACMLKLSKWYFGINQSNRPDPVIVETFHSTMTTNHKCQPHENSGEITQSYLCFIV